MPGVGFEPTMPASEQAKTVHTLVSAATVISAETLILIVFSLRKFMQFGSLPI
jgi:hypothetical protein